MVPVGEKWMVKWVKAMRDATKANFSLGEAERR